MVGHVYTRMLLTLLALFFFYTENTQAWTSFGKPFPEGEVTVIFDIFCFDREGEICEQNGDAATNKWKYLIQSNIQRWNTAGADFRFLTREREEGDDPCNPAYAEVYIILSQPDTLCPGDVMPHILAGGVTFVYPHNSYLKGKGARVYLNAYSPFIINPSTGELEWRFYSLTNKMILHELGHIVGLDHPDAAGQDVGAVMNSQVLVAELYPDDIAGIQALYPPIEPSSVLGVLGNPRHGSFQSGIGVISGWVCDADEVLIDIDGEVQPAAYGTERPDTAGRCGDTDNGFGVLVNWNSLSEGTHVVTALVDGEELGRAIVVTRKFGEEFIRGIQHGYYLKDFPRRGQSFIIRWEESLQNFVILAPID